MLKQNKILLGSAIIVFANFAHAQSVDTPTATPTPSAAPVAPMERAPAPSVTTPDSSGASSQPGAVISAPPPAAVIIVPVAPDTATTSATANTNAQAKSNDPLVQRRIDRAQAKAEYKARKKAAKQEYRAEKKEADANLKAATRSTEGVQLNGDVPSSGR
jgi:hypothetical protein